METPRARGGRVSFCVALVLAMTILAVRETSSAATKTPPPSPSPTCVVCKDVALSLGQRKNASGHQQINVRLERPADCADWQLDVALMTPAHAIGQQQTHVFMLTFNGGTSQRLPPAGYFPLPGFGLVRPARELATWAEANAACSAEGATLAMPTSLPLAAALTNIMPYHTTGYAADWAWLGASDLVQEGQFVSVKGIPLQQMGPYTWYPGSSEPNGGRSENCMVVHKSTGFLGDAPCNWKVTYACQLDI